MVSAELLNTLHTLIRADKLYIMQVCLLNKNHPVNP